MADFKLSYTAEEVDALLNNAKNAVLHTPQELTEEQKAQARENIGAIAENEVDVELIANLESAVFETVVTEGINKFNPDTVTQTTVGSSDCYISDVIPCKVGDRFQVYGCSDDGKCIVINYGLYYVDQSGTEIYIVASTNGAYTVEEHSRIPNFIGIRILIRTANVAYEDRNKVLVAFGDNFSSGLPFVPYSSTVTEKVNLVEDTRNVLQKHIKDGTLTDKKVLVIGDSISANYYGSYTKWVTKLIEQGFFSQDNVINDSVHATGFVSSLSGDGTDCFLNRLQAIGNPSEYDVVIVFGGINDYYRSDSHNIAFASFTSAVDAFFEYLTDTFINAMVCVIRPLRVDWTHATSEGKHQEDYSEYINTVAKSYCLPVLNLTDESGFYPWKQSFKNRWTYTGWGGDGATGDGVHPNEEWQENRLAPMIKSFLKSLI